MLIARSPVRISFAGGGTDLPAYFERYGGAVLSTAINKYFYTIVGSRNDGHIQIISSDLQAIETSSDIRRMEVQGHKLEIPLAVLKEVDCEAALDLFLASEIPPGTGLGSSASACVNVLQAVTAYFEKPLSKQELAEQAFHIANRVLGRPVGKQDEYASAFGGLNYIRFQPDGSTTVTPVQLEADFVQSLQDKLMLFFTGASHHSWSILKEQEAHLQSSNGTLESMHRIRELADRMHQSLLQRDLGSFGELLHEGWQHKKKLCDKISNSAIDRMYGIARSKGAAGGKITGAGGGGFLLLYCDEQHQAAVREALAAEGVREMRFEFDFHGSRVIVNDPFIDRVHTFPSNFPISAQV